MLWPIRGVARLFLPKPSKIIGSIFLSGAAVVFNHVKKSTEAGGAGNKLVEAPEKNQPASELDKR